MKKIGVLVQNDFLTNHFGVRNYFSTIANICAERYQVDYLVHFSTPEGISWFICDVCDILPPNMIENKKMEFSMERDANYWRYKDYNEFINKYHIQQPVPSVYFRSIGANLELERYDLLIITNPWLIDFDMRLSAKKVIGIVYDLIANQFSITKTTLDFSWAHMHHRGYTYYNAYCDEIYAISEEISQQYNLYYGTNKCKYFPPFPPKAFKSAAYNGQKKENAIILAAPFDQRKGIELMPDLLNGVAEYIDMLYIYGTPRCSEDMFNVFFRSIKVKKITYYPLIGNKELISLYQKCKVLLFPSLEEGLGFPIIEAQVCGCRVVTTNKHPMDKLIIDGAYLLSDTSLEVNLKNLHSMLLDEDYKYELLSKRAREVFSYDTLLDIITNII